MPDEAINNIDLPVALIRNKAKATPCVKTYVLDWLMHLLLLSWVFMLFVDGFANERMGFARIETAYYALFLLLAAIRLAYVSTKKALVGYVLVVMTTVVIGILVTEPSTQRLVDDIRYLVRSLIIGVFSYWLYSTSRWIAYKNIRLLLLTFCVAITGFVFLHYVVGIGGITGASGQLKPIYTSYFKEANVVALVYLISWFHLYATTRNHFFRIFGTLIVLFVSILMSSKALTLMILGLVVFEKAWRFSNHSSVNRLVMRATAGIVVVTGILFLTEMSELMIRMFAEMSPDGARILSRMNSQTLLTVLLSTRDLKAMALLNEVDGSGAATWLFGLGAADMIEGNVLVESDPFDIFKFYGLVGVGLYVVAITVIYWLVIRQKYLRLFAPGFYVFYVGSIFAVLAVASFTGHILTGPGAMLMLGMVFGAVASPRIRNEMLNFWLWHRYRYPCRKKIDRGGVLSGAAGGG